MGSLQRSAMKILRPAVLSPCACYCSILKYATVKKLTRIMNGMLGERGNTQLPRAFSLGCRGVGFIGFRV